MATSMVVVDRLLAGASPNVGNRPAFQWQDDSRPFSVFNATSRETKGASSDAASALQTFNGHFDVVSCRVATRGRPRVIKCRRLSLHCAHRVSSSSGPWSVDARMIVAARYM